MKRLLLIGLMLGIMAPAIAQSVIPMLPPHLLKVTAVGEFEQVRDEPTNPNQDVILTKSSGMILPNEHQIGTTVYDYWSN